MWSKSHKQGGTRLWIHVKVKETRALQAVQLMKKRVMRSLEAVRVMIARNQNYSI